MLQFSDCGSGDASKSAWATSAQGGSTVLGKAMKNMSESPREGQLHKINALAFPLIPKHSQSMLM